MFALASPGPWADEKRVAQPACCSRYICSFPSSSRQERQDGFAGLGERSGFRLHHQTPQNPQPTRNEDLQHGFYTSTDGQGTFIAPWW